MTQLNTKLTKPVLIARLCIKVILKMSVIANGECN